MEWLRDLLTAAGGGYVVLFVLLAALMFPFAFYIGRKMSPEEATPNLPQGHPDLGADTGRGPGGREWPNLGSEPRNHLDLRS